MRDFGSCFSEHAVKVSDTTCSGRGSSSSNSSSSNSNSNSNRSGGKLSVVTTTAAAADQSVQTAISSLYRTRLATIHKDVLIKVTWSQTPHMGTVLSVGVDVNDPRNHHLQWQWDPNSISSSSTTPHVLLSKEKGSQSFLSGRSVVVLYWNYSKINPGGPEPISKFYVIVLVDAVPALLLGDLCGEITKSWIPIADIDFSLVSRIEQVVWQSFYSTRARFDEGGKDHDIVLTCKGDAELVVIVDKKRVVHVRRLQWNFRGNQTIFLDGLPVDMMWDVGNWYFSSPPGPHAAAVFMFRRRSALQSRLWLEEEERGVSGFSLLVQAFKNP